MKLSHRISPLPCALLIVFACAAALCADDNSVPVKVSGVVTFDSPNDDYFFIRRDGDARSYRVACNPQTAKPSGLKPGMRVEVEGWERKNSTTPRYVYCHATVTGIDAEPPKPKEMTIPEMHFDPSEDNSLVNQYGEYIVTEGRVTDISRREHNAVLTLSSGGMPIQVTVYEGENVALPSGLGVGAVIRVAGPFLFYVAGDDKGNAIASIHTVSTMVHTFREVEIVRRAPWLTVGRLAAIFVAIAVVFFISLALARVRRRIAAEAREEERLRIAGHLHDNFMQMLIGAKGHIKAARLLVRDDAGAADNSLREAEEIMKDAQKHLKLALWNLLGE